MKELFGTTPLVILGGIAIGVCCWYFIKKHSSQISYHEILERSRDKAKRMLISNSETEKVVGNLLILKRKREGEVAFTLIRRYDSGRTTSTSVSPTFSINICPMEIQEQLKSKNEIVIDNF